jgi:hypothetical protein
MRPAARSPLKEIAIVLAALLPCPVVAAFAGAWGADALERGRALLALEQSLGFAPEAAMHAWAAGHPPLLDAAWAVYLFCHLPAVGGALVWAYLERPAAYPAARDLFLGAQALTVAGYVLVPTAPPRLLDSPEAVSGVASLVQSPWAALPSGHVVFALVAGAVVARLARPWWIRALALAYPVLVTAVTLLTYNHFWLDAVASLLVTAAAAGAVALARRRRAEAPPIPAVVRDAA